MKRTAFFFLILSLSAHAGAQEASTSGLEAERPNMPRLFFNPAQRRILEAIRQGVVEDDALQVPEIDLIVFTEEGLPDPQQEGEVRTRQVNLKIDSLIRNRSNGKTYLRVNNELLDVEKDSDVLSNQGIVLTLEVDDPYSLGGSDEYSDSDFRLKLGQIIGTRGEIEESLPVIKKHQK
jgi:hypothetical protein